ncbi:MAG: Phage derived protein Gp49-like [Ignavibacteria bacterium]|nr:Phage derived protein Gp49-like [Ignavibacteria bacterium]
MIIFTHGFIKKTNKTPNEEIEKAIRYKNLYKSEKT